MEKARCPAILLYLVMGTGIGASEASLVEDAVARIEPVDDSDVASDFRFRDSQVRLGQMLFSDRNLSGNRNNSCATCHHPRRGTSGAVALGLVEGAIGLGPQRTAQSGSPDMGRVPRNAQALYFVGAAKFRIAGEKSLLQVGYDATSALEPAGAVWISQNGSPSPSHAVQGCWRQGPCTVFVTGLVSSSRRLQPASIPFGRAADFSTSGRPVPAGPERTWSAFEMPG